MGGTVGRYLFAVPTLTLIPEFVRDIHRKAEAAGLALPMIIEIHSGETWDRTGKALPPSARVPRLIKQAAEDYRHVDHVIIVITHEGLISADLSGYHGWQMIVDEVPNTIATGNLKVPASSSWFQATYELEPMGDGRHAKVVIRNGVDLSSKMLAGDDLLADLTVFHRRVSSPTGVIVDLLDWQDARDRRRVVEWASVWTPAELAAFDTITFSAASWFTSIAYMVSRTIDGDAVTYVRVPVGEDTERSPRSVRIRYFTDSHTGSTSFWCSDAGEEALRTVGQWLARNASPNQYWSSNGGQVRAVLRACGVPGKNVRPKQAGTNMLRDRTECSMIYSNKMRDDDAPLYSLFGLMNAEINRAKETEDIGQFCLRGAPRCPEWSGEYVVNLYSLDQAEDLRAFLLEQRLADYVELEHVRLGLGVIVRAGRGWHRKIEETPETAAAKAERQKKTDAERKRLARQAAKDTAIANGTYRSRGRPKKAA